MIFHLEDDVQASSNEPAVSTTSLNQPNRTIPPATQGPIRNITDKARLYVSRICHYKYATRESKSIEI